jgi:ribosomal protein L11 methyltransferase
MLTTRFASLEVKTEISTQGLNETDWANCWKKYYKPVRIGKHVVIVPMWEEFSPEVDDVVVRMDPGMAFGTGTHETTALCAELIEKYMDRGVRALDVGTGSGILAICASKLGAAKCAACDIDPIAVRTEKENAERNDCANIDCYVSDLLSDVKTIDGKAFDIVTANIVADIIIRLAPDVGAFIRPDGLFIASGIIDEREADVDAALTKYGLKKLAAKHEKGWCAVLFKKP